MSAFGVFASCRVHDQHGNDVQVYALPMFALDEVFAMPRHWRWLTHLIGAMAHELMLKVFFDGGYHHTRGTRIIPQYVEKIEREAANLERAP